MSGSNRNASQQLGHISSPITNFRVRSQILPIGTIPYDSMTLPIVSPDGKYIATRTGAAPSWDVTIAAPNAKAQMGSRIEIYEITYATQPPTLVATVLQPALLGRSCDRDGFLIEAPQDDGSRWIGKVKWTDGTIEWLVDDNKVNAFASLGPDGRLAWSRQIEGGRFELVIRHVSEPWVLEAGEGDWLFPTWSGRGDGLFVERRVSGLLQMIYSHASGPQEFYAGAQMIEIVQDATMLSAYQTVNANVNVLDGRPTPREEITFFHLTYNRLALWIPSVQRTPTVFALNTFFGVPDEAGFMIAMTNDTLIRQRIDNLNDRAELLPGKLAPRPIAHEQWMYILLEPGDGRVGLSAMRLLPADSPLWQE